MSEKKAAPAVHTEATRPKKTEADQTDKEEKPRTVTSITIEPVPTIDENGNIDILSTAKQVMRTSDGETHTEEIHPTIKGGADSYKILTEAAEKVVIMVNDTMKAVKQAAGAGATIAANAMKESGSQQAAASITLLFSEVMGAENLVTAFKTASKIAETITENNIAQVLEDKPAELKERVQAIVEQFNGYLIILTAAMELSKEQPIQGVTTETDDLKISEFLEIYLEPAVEKLEAEIKEANKNQRKTRKGKKNLQIEKIPAPNDTVTNALFYPNRPNGIKPQDYITGEYKELSTGGNISTLLKVETEKDIVDEFGLTPTDQDWLENVYAIAQAGETQIDGADLLRLAGIKNPYDIKHNEIRLEAINSIDKATRTRIAIDSTAEAQQYKKKRGKKIRSDTTAQPLISGVLHITEYTDDKRDFWLELRPPIGENDPIEALPHLRYAMSKGQLVPIDRKLLDFPFKLQSENRTLARYLYRRIAAKYQKHKTIRLETLISDLGIDLAAERRKPTQKQIEADKKLTEEELAKKQQERINNRIKSNRKRLLDTIEKIMNFWEQEGFIKSWEFTPKNAKIYTTITYETYKK